MPEQAAVPTPSPEAGRLPVVIAAKDPALRYGGRFVLEPKTGGGRICQWPASSVTLRFDGTDLNVTLRDEKGTNRWQVVLDGKPTNALFLRRGERTYRLASDLPKGEHTIELYKATEPLFGTTIVMGFELAAGGNALPAPEERRGLEVIGDSISCGYGNEVDDPHEHLTPWNENAWLAYGAVAARLLGADYTCVAWSGKKMYPDRLLPEIYGLVLPTEAIRKWDFSAHPTPRVVVITLGTNDLAGGTPDQAGWIAAYKAFVARVRGHYPDADLYCATSPMLDNTPPNMRRQTLHYWLTRVVNEVNEAGDGKVRFLDFPAQKASDGIGADYHPSRRTHELMGQQLAETVRRDLGW